MYEEQTQEAIFDRMYDNLPDGITALEGTFMGNALQPAASELAEAYIALEGICQNASAVTAEDYEALKNKGLDIGLHPLDAYKATGTVTFTGDQGSEIEAGTEVQTETGLVFLTLLDAAIDESGEVDIPIEAEDFGVKYNVPPQSIIDLPAMIVGVVSVANHAAMAGGTDEEDMEQFRQRLLDRIRRPSTGGSKYDFENWAREVPGVGFAKCYPRWQGRGTVQVLVCDPDGLPGSESLCQKVHTYIEEKRPIGADVDVSAPNSTEVNISVRISSIDPLAFAAEKIEQKIRDFLKTLVFSGSQLSLAQVGKLIFEVPGVSDYAGLLINGQAESADLPDKSVFVLGGVVVEQL